MAATHFSCMWGSAGGALGDAFGDYGQVGLDVAGGSARDVRSPGQTGD